MRCRKSATDASQLRRVCGSGCCRSVRERFPVDLDKLKSLGRDLVPPFEIALADGGCTVVAIHRLLPGRRLAARGRHRGRDVFVKLFFGRGARRAWERDRQGAGLLRSCGVDTPELLLETATAQPGGFALLFEFLEQARPIGTGASAEVGDHAALAVECLARLHEQGAVHHDANLDNFMVRGGRLVVVDGAAVRQTPGLPWRHRQPRQGDVHPVRQTHGALGETASLKALAAFLAEYPPAEDHRVPGLLSRYAAARGWADDAGRRARLDAELAGVRRARVRRYLAKTERDCTEFLVERGWRRSVLAKRSRWTAALADFAQDPQACLDGAEHTENGRTPATVAAAERIETVRPATVADEKRAEPGRTAAIAGVECIKNGRSATVFRLRLGGEPMVVKRYNVKSAPHRVRRWFRHRSRIAWRNGHRLAFLGIPGAEPVALVERRWGPLRAESWLVMPDCGSRDVQAEVRARGWSETLLTGLVRIFLDLAAVGLHHGDAKASNFLVQEDRVCLIDLDGMRERSGSARDVARFLRNFDGQALAEVRSRFAAEGLFERAE